MPTSLSIPATEDGVAALRSFVEQQAEALGLDQAAVYDLVVALHELAVNSVVHGYRGRAGMIELELEPSADGLVARLRDTAPPFDPTRVPEPDPRRPLEMRAPGGFGLLLVRRLTETFTYRPLSGGGNEIMLFKRHTV